MLVIRDLQTCQVLLCSRELLAEPRLFLAGDVIRHRAGHGFLGPLAPFSLNDLDPRFELRSPVGGRLGVVVQIGEQPVADAGRLLVGDPFAVPLLLDDWLDEVLAQVGQVAAVLVAVPSVAEPVGVLVATASGGDAIQQLAVAVPAEQCPGQVVLAPVGPFAGLSVSGDDVLHPGPGLGRGQPFVAAVELNALPGDGALVVRVVQHLAEFLGCQRPGGPLGGRSLGQSADLQFSSELAQAPVAGGVGVEREADEVCPVGVGLDSANLDAADDVPDVQVADRCQARRAAGLDFLMHAFDDFGSEVGAVELVDRPQDPVQQHPRGCFVDVLHAGDEGGSGLPDGQVQLHVIEAIAGQAVELVDDDVLDGVLGQVREHLLERFTVSGLGGLAGFHELPHDDGIERSGFALPGLTLRRNGEAFGRAAAGGLFLGADPQVEDGLVLGWRVLGGESGHAAAPSARRIGVRAESWRR